MREARRLGWLTAAIAAAALLVVVVALTVVATRLSWGLPSFAELARACQGFALAHVDTGSILVLVLGSVSLASIVLAGRSLVRGITAARRFERELARFARPESPGVWRLDTDWPMAFCAGLHRPKVYVSRGALELLDERQRQAVVAHEAHHAARRDPLRLLIARAVSDGLFFLPVLRRLADRCAALAEVAADEAAVRATGSVQPLASVLLLVESHPEPTAVGIAPERVDHLLGRRARFDLPVLMLLGSLALTGLLAAVTVRVAQMTDHASVSIPQLAAELCMVAMAMAPIVLGAGGLLGARHVLRGRRR